MAWVVAPRVYAIDRRFRAHGVAGGVMASSPRVVIIGAGIVGCALADELTERGWTEEDAT